MAAISLLLGQKQFKTTIGVLELDAALSVSHEFESTLSKNPIENSSSGLSDAIDQVKLENRRVNIDGFISEAPFNLITPAVNLFTSGASRYVGEVAGGFGNQLAQVGLGSIAGIIASRNGQDANFPLKAFNYLKELRRNRIPFTIVTRLERYENMMITRLTVPQLPENGQSLQFSMTCEQIEIVETKSVSIPERLTKTGNAKTENRGKQTPVEANAETSKKSTLLFDGYRKARGALGF